jgi:ATP-binding cassette subfamily C protein LapB
MSQVESRPEEAAASAEILQLRADAAAGGSRADRARRADAAAEPQFDPGAAGRPAAGTPGPAHNSFSENLDALAEAWNRPVPPPGTGLTGGLPGPEALASLAAQRGLEVETQQRKVATLGVTDFPCILLMSDATTRLLVGRRGDVFQVKRAEGIVDVRLADLEALETGVTFLPRPSIAAGEAMEEQGAPEAREEKQGVLRLMLRMMWRDHRGRLIAMAVANLIGNALLLALPLYSMAVYDRVVPHLAMETLWALTIGVTIALLADLMVRTVKARVLDAAAYSVSTAIQARFFNRLVHTELASAPRLAAAATAGLRDIESLCLAVPSVFTALVIDLPFLLVIMALLVSFGGYVALVPVLAVVILLVIYAIAHAVGESEAIRRANLSRMQATLLQETIDGLETVKSVSAEAMLLRRWEALADAAAYSGHRSRTWNGFSSIASMCIGQIVIVGAMVTAVLEISNGLLTIGALSATSMLVGRVLAPITQVVTTLHQMKLLLKTLDGIDVVLKAPVERAGDGNRAPAPRGLIEFRGVSFGYRGAEEAGLKDVTLTIRPGERVALIGRIGCGKSTLLRLMIRLYVARSGAVLLDGINIRQFDPQVIRRRMGLMSQHHALFDDTLNANLVFGLGQVSQQCFDRAVTVSGVRDLAARQPDGYSMRVGPRGERLSGGERQLVALARTLMGQPDILILDEPTAAMDNGLEMRVIRDLKEELGDRTLIVATHRAAVLDLVERIIWIDDGRIVADGPKAEVLSRLRRTAA